MQTPSLPGIGSVGGSSRTATKLMWFFALVYVAEGCAQVSGILHQPLFYFLMDGLHWQTSQVTAYLAVLGLPWVIKPVYGLVSDCVPLFGYRRKSYLFLFNFAATLALLSLTTITSPGQIIVALFVIVVAMAASSALCGALLVEHGKNSGLAGRFCSVQTIFVNIANIGAAFVGGWLCHKYAPADALHYGAAIAIFAPLLVVVSTYKLIDEKKEKADFKLLREGFGSIGRALRTRSLWGVAGFLFLWAFNPGFGAPFYDHMKKHLAFDQAFIGNLAMIYAIGAALGGFVYMKWLSPRLSVRTLAGTLIVSGAAIQAFFVFMVDKESAMALHLVNGFVTSMALLNAHVIAANRCPAHAEGFMYGILLSTANLSFNLSQTVGGYLYDEKFHGQIGPLILLSAGITFACVFLLPFFHFEKGDGANAAAGAPPPAGH